VTALTAAIFLGAAGYPHADSFSNPAFRRSKVAIDDYIRGPVPNGLGVSANAVLDLFDSKLSATDQLEEIGGFLQRIQNECTDPERNVVLYYIGHGYLTGPHNEYFLAVSSVRDDNLESSGMLARKLGEKLRPSARSARIFLILDCCFAGHAKIMSPSSAVLVDSFAKSPVKDRSDNPRGGMALLCASSQDSVAYAPEGNDLTVFTNAFLSVLREGEKTARPYLSLQDVKEKVWEKIDSSYPRDSDRKQFRVLPEVHPIDQTEGDISQLTPLFPNASGCRPTKAKGPRISSNRVLQLVRRSDNHFFELISSLNRALDDPDSVFDVDWTNTLATSSTSAIDLDVASEKYLLRLFLQKLLYAASEMHESTCGSANIWVCHSTRPERSTGKLLPSVLRSAERQGHFDLNQLVTRGAQRVYLRANPVKYGVEENKNSVAAQVTLVQAIRFEDLSKTTFGSEQERRLGISHILGVPLFDPKIEWSDHGIRGVPLAMTVDFSFREAPAPHITQAVLSRAEELRKTFLNFQQRWCGAIRL